jgi:uncharacterized protein
MIPTPSLKLLRIISLILFLLPVQLCIAQKHYTLEQIPDPKANGASAYVSDPDNVLGEAYVAGLNPRLTQLEQDTKVQIAVVVVKDFDEHAEMFDFATKLFRKWGIGKAVANNGLLLFIATDRHEYRFISGYGLEGLLPDITLKKTGDEFLVPAFKEGDYGGGVSAAINHIADYLGQSGNKPEVDQLAQKKQYVEKPWMETFGICALIILAAVLVTRSTKKHMPFIAAKGKKDKNNGYDKVTMIGCGGLFIIIFVSIFLFAFTIGFGWLKAIKLTTVPYILYGFVALSLFFRYYGALSANRKFYKDDENFAHAVQQLNKVAWWYIIVSPLILISILIEEIRRKNIVKRFKAPLDPRKQPMVRINRDENPSGKPYITLGQLAEENAGSYIYDIWVSTDGKEDKVIANEGDNFDDFTECPQCKFKTLCKPKTITLIEATYSREGKGKEVRRCDNCNYEELIKMVVFPMLTKSSSSSSSSGGGGRSSSSSSSWGGGSSGGGGAGGKW